MEMDEFRWRSTNYRLHLGSRLIRSMRHFDSKRKVSEYYRLQFLNFPGPVEQTILMQGGIKTRHLDKRDSVKIGYR